MLCFFAASHIFRRVVKVGDNVNTSLVVNHKFYPKHNPLQGMSRERWEQIKRYSITKILEKLEWTTTMVNRPIRVFTIMFSGLPNIFRPLVHD